MQNADLSNFNLLNGTTALGCALIGMGMIQYNDARNAANSTKRQELTSESKMALIVGTISLLPGTIFSVTVNDCPTFMQPFLLKNLEVYLSHVGLFALVMGVDHLFSISRATDQIKNRWSIGIASTLFGGSCLYARCRHLL